jgi:hypothetical protein
VQTRLIFFEGGGFSGKSATHDQAALALDPVRFFIPESRSFECDLPTGFTLNELAKTLGAVRHETFDYAVGNMGSRCSLFNLSQISNAPSQIRIGQVVWNGNWLAFPQAVRSLTDGDCRRYLQLAVQYISSGGVDENVVAAHTDAGLLKILEEKMKAP